MGHSISTTLKFEEVEINAHGDKIFISPDDSSMMRNFVNCFENIIKMSDECDKKAKEIGEKYDGKEEIEYEISMMSEICALHVDFSNDSIKQIDGIFGDGTIRTYFREHYEKIPNFLPGMACFMDFFSQMNPVMEYIFGKTASNIEQLSKARMEKYQPQDHKRPQK